eukprot:4565210-Amphidinium_carterae.1
MKAGCKQSLPAYLVDEPAALLDKIHLEKVQSLRFGEHLSTKSSKYLKGLKSCSDLTRANLGLVCNSHWALQ